MRSLLCILFLVFFLAPLSLILLPAFWIYGKFQPEKAELATLAVVRWGFRVIRFLAGAQVTVRGQENIPKNRAVLYVSNHRSFFDVVISYPLTQGRCGYVAKQEIRKVPVLSLWMRRIHCLFLDRADMRDAMRMMKDSVHLIRSGISVWICPEGTRNHEEGVLPFKAGSFKIAEMSGCPVVPVTFTHTDDILENHFPWVRRTDVSIEFGKPVETAGMTREEKKALPEMVQKIVEETYRKNGGA